MIEESMLTPEMGVVLTGTREDLPQVQRSSIDRYLRERGAVMLRGFDLTVEEYEDLSREMSPEFLVHHDVGRMFISEDGTTQSVVPGTYGLPAHVERGYAAPIPGLLFFYCNKPADEDGETTLFDGYEIFNQLSPEAQDFFRGNKIRYRLRIAPELWQRTLMTDDHAEALYLVDQQLSSAVDREIGESASCRVEGDVLIMDFVTPSTRRSPRREGDAFSNSSLTYVHSLSLPQEGVLAVGGIDLRTEDDRPFPADMLEEAIRAANAAEIKVKWNKGDMVFLDNRTVLHGRAPFRDQSRSVYVRIGFETL
jgi:alpha-ketoglutarate-dependent taurine dioxygenase